MKDKSDHWSSKIIYTVPEFNLKQIVFTISTEKLQQIQDFSII